MPPTIAPGMQRLSIRQVMRVVGCREANCDWFLNGQKGMDEGAPFTHPAGVNCGDVSRCKPCANPVVQGVACGTCIPCQTGTANCPCPQRISFDGARMVYGHMVPDDQVDEIYRINPGGHLGSRVVVQDEWNQKMGDSVETVQRILTRGL